MVRVLFVFVFILSMASSMASQGLLAQETEEDTQKEESAVGSTLYDFLNQKRLEAIGDYRSQSRGLPFSLFEEGDSAIQLNQLRSSVRGRLKTKGRGAGDNAKVLQGRLKLHASVHLLHDLLQAHLGGTTGDHITSPWGQISGGDNQQYHFNFRNFYGLIQPVAGAKYQFGIFPPYHGLGSDITLKDGDANLAGHRLQLDLDRLTKETWLARLGDTVHRVTVETTFYGDETEQNVFSRGDRLNNSNSARALVESAEAELFDQKIRLAAGFERFDHQDYMILQALFSLNNLFVQRVVAQSLVELGREESHAIGVHAQSDFLDDTLHVHVGFSVVSDDFDYPHDDKYGEGSRYDIIVSYDLPYGLFTKLFWSDRIKYAAHANQGGRYELHFGIDVIRAVTEWLEEESRKSQREEDLLDAKW